MHRNRSADVTWRLTKEESEYIMRQLADRPFREVANLLNKLAAQLNAQAIPALAPQKKQEPIDPGPPAQGGARGNKRK